MVKKQLENEILNEIEKYNMLNKELNKRKSRTVDLKLAMEIADEIVELLSMKNITFSCAKLSLTFAAEFLEGLNIGKKDSY